MHVLAKATKNCKDCREPCAAGLLRKLEIQVLSVISITSLKLSHVSLQSGHLASSNFSSLDPNPALTLSNYAKRTDKAEDSVTSVNESKSRLRKMREASDLLEAQAELVALEAEKSGKAAGDAAEEDKEMSASAGDLRLAARETAKEVEGIVRHLRNYAREGSPEMVRLKPALEEAKRILEDLSAVDHAGADLRARRELSHARQTLNMVREILFGHGAKVGKLRERLMLSERKMNDLLQYVDRVLANVREVIFVSLLFVSPSFPNTKHK